MAAKTFTHKISGTTLHITLTGEPYGEGGKKGLHIIEVDGKRLNNFRQTATGYRSGTALMGSYPESFTKAHGMVLDSNGRANFPASMKPEAVAKAIAELTYGPKVAKAEAKAKAKAEATAKAEAAKTEAKPKRGRSVKAKAQPVAEATAEA